MLNQNFAFYIDYDFFQINEDEIKKITQERDQLDAELKIEQQKCKDLGDKLTAEISKHQKVNA